MLVLVLEYVLLKVLVKQKCFKIVLEIAFIYIRLILVFCIAGGVSA